MLVRQSQNARAHSLARHSLARSFEEAAEFERPIPSLARLSVSRGPFPPFPPFNLTTASAGGKTYSARLTVGRHFFA